MTTEPLRSHGLPIVSEALLTERVIIALGRGKPFLLATLDEAVAFVRADKPGRVPRWLDRAQLVSDADLQQLRAGRRVAHPNSTVLVPCVEDPEL